MQKTLKLLAFFAVLSASLVLSANQAKADGYSGLNSQNKSSASQSPSTEGAAGGDAAMSGPNAGNASGSSLVQPAGMLAGAKISGIFKLANNPTVYVLIDGSLRPFTSEAAFASWGFKFSQVQTVSQAQLANYAMSAPLGIADGTIVKTTGSDQAYIVFAGQKNVAAPQALVSHLGLSLKNTITVSAQDLTSVPLGPPITE